MPQKAEKNDGMQIYRLKITLKGTSPPIWRRVDVPSDVPLADLHQMIQVSMGWTDSHLWEIQAGQTLYSDPSFYDDYDELGHLDGRKTALSAVLKREKNKINYLYDFGDHWLHEIQLEKRFPPEPNIFYPVCIAGKRACPPEDCGSIPGFYQLLDILSDPGNEEYDSMLEWVGGEFDPEKFDKEKVNRILGTYKKKI